jgi:tryptophanyl-tRNA synthetase
MSQRHLSGIQPSGQLHLGNYFGAIRQHVAHQDDGFYFIANYHALTTLHDAAALRANTVDVATTYLACGLDPSRAVLFRQSDVPEVTELTWLLETVTPMGLLERAVSYKDKVAKGLSASVGLFTYPALMAADILAYRSQVVPVGPDQVQHVEMTRDMAGAFNRTFGEVFVVPEHRLGTEVVVPGIDGTKMSKSYGNHIPIFASGKELSKLVMSIKTSSAGVEDPKDPETCTVFQIYALMASEAERAELAARYRAGGMGYGEAKKTLLAKIEETFAPMRARREALVRNPAQVEDVLRDGARKARAIAREVTDAARAACGLV